MSKDKYLLSDFRCFRKNVNNSMNGRTRGSGGLRGRPPQGERKNLPLIFGSDQAPTGTQRSVCLSDWLKALNSQFILQANSDTTIFFSGSYLYGDLKHVRVQFKLNLKHNISGAMEDPSTFSEQT